MNSKHLYPAPQSCVQPYTLVGQSSIKLLIQFTTVPAVSSSRPAILQYIKKYFLLVLKVRLEYSTAKPKAIQDWLTRLSHNYMIKVKAETNANIR